MTTLADAVGLVKVTEEDRIGCTRTRFKHWSSGDDAGDGCDTRNEVLIAEAVVAPTMEAGCKSTGGTRRSYDDGQEVTSAGSLDIDHMVPLAESLGLRHLDLGGGGAGGVTRTTRARTSRSSR